MSETQYPRLDGLPVFDIGLVMAGAISAGAYTAGALDFLFEALDCFDRAREAGEAPRHRVRLKVVSGASAGSMCAAIAAVSLDRKFPHVKLSQGIAADGSLLDQEVVAGVHVEGDNRHVGDNPFYSAWVTDIDIRKMLTTEDLKRKPTDTADPPVVSALNSLPIAGIVDRLLAKGKGEAVDRRWIADPVAIRFALGNLRGIPYSFDFRGNTAGKHWMVLHGDDFSFELTKGAPEDPKEPDWFGLRRTGDTPGEVWRSLGYAAVSSGAFPVALKSIRLERRLLESLRSRAFVLPGDGVSEDHYNRDSRIVRVAPSWVEQKSPYSFLNVDGGIINNEPLELAREVLLGDKLARAPRDGRRATSATVMIDPFVDRDPLGPDGDRPLIGTILPLVSTWKSQARFKPVDLALAQDEKVYSRFLLAPDRGENARKAPEHVPDEATLKSIEKGAVDLSKRPHPCASGGLGGFLGFLHEDYRRHDYMLGRRNCQRFLAEAFTLPSGNGLFDEWGALKTDERWMPKTDKPGDPHLPIVPLCGSARDPQPLPAWPKGRLGRKELSQLKDMIGDRADAVKDRMISSLGWGPWLWLNAGWLGGGRTQVLDLAMGKIAEALEVQRL